MTLQQLKYIVAIDRQRNSELVAEDKGAINGELALSVGPTIAPYILPKFIRLYVENYPTLSYEINSGDKIWMCRPSTRMAPSCFNSFRQRNSEYF